MPVSCSSSSGRRRGPAGSTASWPGTATASSLSGPDLASSSQTADDQDDHGGWPLDRQPYHLETSVPGVFAVGDVRAESAKRVASAVGEGAMAVMLVHRYLETL